MLDLLIRNGTIVDGQGSVRGSIAVANGEIVARFKLGADLPQARTVIDADELLVLPGIVDPHVHFYGEGIGDYSKLAATGGVTTFIGMIRGRPEQNLAEMVGENREAGNAASVVDFTFHVVLYDREDTIPQLAALTADGFYSFKMFLAYKRRGMMVREEFLFAAMQEISRLGGVALIHAENGEMIDRLEQAAIAAGQVGFKNYAPTRPTEAEASAIDVASLAARATKCKAYIVHVSSSAGLAAVEQARRRGVPLMAETCPQYILLGDDAVRRLGPAAVVAPPLREAPDRLALSTALATGAINTVGSDHASYDPAAKARGKDNIFLSPFGMPGAPTLLPSMFTWAMDNDVPLPVMVRAMTEAPARIFGLGHRKGSLLPGGDADIVLIDPKLRRTVDAQAVWPKIAPSPMVGQSLAGWPVMTIARGEVVFRDGQVVAKGGRGKLIEQKHPLNSSRRGHVGSSAAGCSDSRTGEPT